MTNDTTLLEYYMQGFNDELDNKEHLVLRSVDYLTNEEILSRIKSANLVRQ